MELAKGPERTIDGIANGREIVLGHAKTREAMRAGLAMYFETLHDPALMELANAIVAELRIEHFFNIQLVGEHVIEINPRISTVVYQEDLNLPYLGVKRALGEVSDDELRALRGRVRPGRTALRYFDQLEWDA
jgi:ATP-grasp in the biosynthetic pathway with Ter operon